MSNSDNSKGIKFITKLRLSLSHLRENKFKHSFQDSLDLFCNGGLMIESTAHYLFHCPTYITERLTFLSIIENINNNLVNLSEPVLIKTFFSFMMEKNWVLVYMILIHLFLRIIIRNKLGKKVERLFFYNTSQWLRMLYSKFLHTK